MDILLVGQKRTDTKSYQTNENITGVISFNKPRICKDILDGQVNRKRERKRP